MNVKMKEYNGTYRTQATLRSSVHVFGFFNTMFKKYIPKELTLTNVRVDVSRCFIF